MLEKKKSLKSMTSFSPSESIRRAKKTQNRREKIVQIRLKKKSMTWKISKQQEKCENLTVCSLKDQQN